jgi:hypothetical protein
MPSLDRTASREQALKRGACLEYGCERTSATVSIPCLVNRSANFSAEWLECPTVNTEFIRVP